jgi:hypothetical protein
MAIACNLFATVAATVSAKDAGFPCHHQNAILVQLIASTLYTLPKVCDAGPRQRDIARGAASGLSLPWHWSGPIGFAREGAAAAVTRAGVQVSLARAWFSARTFGALKHPQDTTTVAATAAATEAVAVREAPLLREPVPSADDIQAAKQKAASESRRIAKEQWKASQMQEQKTALPKWAPAAEQAQDRCATS